MPKRMERLIDEALLFTATQTGVLYMQRRSRRVLPKVAVGTAVLAGVGAAAATAAAGLGAVGLAGGAVAWYRRRERNRVALTSSGAGAPGTAAQPNLGDWLQSEHASEPSGAHG